LAPERDQHEAFEGTIPPSRSMELNVVDQAAEFSREPLATSDVGFLHHIHASPFETTTA
jgi:hypothetical protein